MRSFRCQSALVLVMLGSSAIAAAAAHLRSETLDAWNSYVSATEARIARELISRSGFLAIDFDKDGIAERRAVQSGSLLVRKAETLGARGQQIDVPVARIHHWRGDVLIAGVSVPQLLEELEHAPPPQEDVLQSKVLERGPDRMRVYLQLQRSRLVTVAYNTEHVVTFVRYGATRATSTSTAIRIAEVSDPNTPQEREQPVGDDHGFLWRLNAYWRYEEVAGGTIAECESISLSRDVPSLVRPIVDPLIDRTARDSMERALVALRAHFLNRQP